MADFYDSRSYIYQSNRNFLEQLRKSADATISRNRDYQPVRLDANARKICKSWWGIAWCRNLERYADWENRIARGKTYLKAGAVVDLKINGGKINAKVQGNRRRPYDIEIIIDPIKPRAQTKIERQAVGKIQNLESLINGTFPEDLKELFFERDGLFPAPKEIHFNCNCPDWANMCKHVTAVLYGIGVRLDDDPLYFFQMRAIDVDDFISKVVGGKIDAMMRKVKVVSPRIIKNADLTKLFGI